MWRVLADFADLEDGGFVYRKGDLYPRKGAGTNDRRAAQLSGSNNKRGIPLIEKYNPPKKRKSEG